MGTSGEPFALSPLLDVCFFLQVIKGMRESLSEKLTTMDQRMIRMEVQMDAIASAQKRRPSTDSSQAVNKQTAFVRLVSNQVSCRQGLAQSD